MFSSAASHVVGEWVGDFVLLARTRESREKILFTEALAAVHGVGTVYRNIQKSQPGGHALISSRQTLPPRSVFPNVFGNRHQVIRHGSGCTSCRSIVSPHRRTYICVRTPHRKPSSVVEHHRKRAVLIWVGLIVTILACKCMRAMQDGTTR